jgi:L-seryl-tRNA(Ser) seleniumtransferase
MDSTVGGGSLPGETLPSFGLAVRAGSAARMLTELRRGSPCVVARVADGAVLLDLRTVPAADDMALGQAIAHLRAG